MKRNAVIYVNTSSNKDYFEIGLTICYGFANQNNYNVIKSTDDFNELLVFVTTNPNYDVIIPSYYNFAEEQDDIGFIAFLEVHGVNVVSASEILDDCPNLRYLYEYYKREVFDNRINRKFAPFSFFSTIQKRIFKYFMHIGSIYFFCLTLCIYRIINTKKIFSVKKT